jgi:hypothetical protein
MQQSTFVPRSKSRTAACRPRRQCLKLVVVEGTPQEVANNAMAREYFLGEQFRLD